MTLPDFIRYCAEQGLEGIDLLDVDHYPWLWAGKEDLAKVPEWACREGVAIAVYAAGNNFAKSDEAAWRKEVEAVRQVILRARDCGAPVVRIFGGYHCEAGGDPEMSTSRGLERVVAGIAECLSLAESSRVVLALENHGRLPGHSHESRAVVDHFASPWLKVTYDPANYHGNSMDEDEDPLRAYERLRDHVAHVHLKDVWPAKLDLKRRREPCVAGEGMTPLRQVVAELAADRYQGFCSLEYEAGRIVPEREGVTQSLAYLREAIAIAEAQWLSKI